jgi:hypothetical protein
VLRGNKAIDDRKNARDRNVNANSASARNKVGSKAVAANRVAVSQADDRRRSVGLTSGGRQLPPLSYLAYAKTAKRSAAILSLEVAAR